MAPRCRDIHTIKIFFGCLKSVIFYLFASRFYAITVILEKVAV